MVKNVYHDHGLNFKLSWSNGQNSSFLTLAKIVTNRGQMSKLVNFDHWSWGKFQGVKVMVSALLTPINILCSVVSAQCSSNVILSFNQGQNIFCDSNQFPFYPTDKQRGGGPTKQTKDILRFFRRHDLFCSFLFSV